MNGIKIEHAGEDLRPGFVVEDVDGADFGRIKVQTVTGVPVFVLRNVKDFSVWRSRGVADAEFASVETKEI